jgi:hypothetical protein
MEKLKVGDIIKIENGDQCYTDIKGKFVYSNSISNTKSNSLIRVGDVLTCDSSKIKRKIASILQNLDKELEFVVDTKVKDKTLDSVKKLIVNATKEDKFDTNKVKGEYVVIEAKLNGGSKSSGYPDGWEVTAIKLKNGEYNKNGRKISFYQSGSFTAIIEQPKIIGFMEMEVSFKH